MKTDWKQSAIDRRDFRHTHDGPEIPKGGVKPSKKKKKKFKIVHVVTGKKVAFTSTYKTRKAAEQAMESLKKSPWLGLIDIQMEVKGDD